MDVRSLHPWDVTPGRASEIQDALRQRRIDEPPPGLDPETVAGADVSVRRGRSTGFGALSTLSTGSLRSVEEIAVEERVSFPYVPGLLSFRELPVLAAAWKRASVRPDVVVFDGHGLAHPRRFGLACHGGVLFDVPSIGCAKSVLVGEHAPPGEEKGATAPLVHDGEIVGMALRTRESVRPVYVSVGHRMDLETAVELIHRLSPRYRIPEPVRRSDRLAGQRRREWEDRRGPDGGDEDG